jgi:hypothetical protein
LTTQLRLFILIQINHYQYPCQNDRLQIDVRSGQNGRTNAIVCTDIQGESVEPGAVFNTVHNLFTQFVDFRSEVESRILAFNGPKNSGKSTDK